MDDRLWLIILGVLLGLSLVVNVILALPESSRVRRFFVKLFGRKDRVSEEEILQMVDAGEETGAIQQEEREMIENIFELNDTTAEDVMVHRTDMVFLQVDDSREEILQVIRESGLTRLPVYDEDPDDVIGILNVREFLLNTQSPEPKTVRELLRDPYFVPETVRTDLLFRDMQSKKIHLAIVVDEYGGTAGLVTLEDLLEEIVGNIYDEFDPAEEAEIVPLGEDLWRIAGSAELEQVEEALEVSIPDSEEYDTLGGLIFAQLHVIPEDGEQMDLVVDRLAIHVESIAEHRVEWCTVRKLERPETAGDTEE